MSISRFIWVTFQKEGVHSYPAAPDDVSFLRHPHRHIFHFKVKIQVQHNERDIEFIRFKRELENLYTTTNENKTLGLNNMSCESIAEELISYLTTYYPQRVVMVEVSEDGENGAILMANL